MMRRIQIDLNRRTVTGQTPAKYVGPTPSVGELVTAFEPEDGVEVDAVVASVDVDRCVVYLDVDWSTTRDDEAMYAVAAPRTFGAGALRGEDVQPTGGSGGATNLLVRM